jgi:predicted house-cleaning NTP pyrophosphatase (Maf/HAM1 superfamily)
MSSIGSVSRAQQHFVLASGSLRRHGLLEEAGFSAEIEPADIDDALIQIGAVAAADVAPALAHFKAQRVAAQRWARGAEPVPARLPGRGRRLRGAPALVG